MEFASDPPPFLTFYPWRQEWPVIVTSPHSGQYYPRDFIRQTAVTKSDLRKLEDPFVDELWNFIPQSGGVLLAQSIARAYIDVNRDPMELDPDMFQSPLPVHVANSSRIKWGLGSIPKYAAPGINIYLDKIHFTDVLQRIDLAHRPFHQQLQYLVQSVLARFKFCLIIDCHSMPNIAVSQDPSIIGTDIVLGDRYGQSADERIVRSIENAFIQTGFSVKRNSPYAGGFIAANYGARRPQINCVQIEINRQLYMNEGNMEKHDGFFALQRRLQTVWKLLTQQFLMNSFIDPLCDVNVMAAE